eukprot:673042-Hanusia_phi.AAC.3
MDEGKGGVDDLREKRKTAGKRSTDPYLEQGKGRSENAGEIAENSEGAVKKRKVKIAMRAALQTHGTDQEEGIWVGEPAGKWKGNNLYVGVILRGKFYASGADVYIRGEEGERQYIARIARMYERASDSARMITCRWFYRSNETNLHKDKKKSSPGVESTSSGGGSLMVLPGD